MSFVYQEIQLKSSIFYINMMKLRFWNDKYTKTGSLFSTETSNTNCRLIRLNFLPSIRVSTLISAKLKRVPFPLNMIGKHESMENRGSFTISWFIIWNKKGWHMQMSILYNSVCINLYIFQLLWKYVDLGFPIQIGFITNSNHIYY